MNKEDMNLDQNAMHFLQGFINQNEFIKKQTGITKPVNNLSTTQRKEEPNIPSANNIPFEHDSPMKIINLGQNNHYSDNFRKVNNVFMNEKEEEKIFNPDRIIEEQLEHELDEDVAYGEELKNKFNINRKHYQHDRSQVINDMEGLSKTSMLKVSKNPFNKNHNQIQVDRKEYEDIQYQLNQWKSKTEVLESSNQELKVANKILESQLKEWQDYQKQNIDYFDEVEFYQNELRKYRLNYQKLEDKVDQIEKDKQREVLQLKKKIELQNDKDGDMEKMRIMNQDLRQEITFQKGRIRDLEDQNQIFEKQVQKYRDNTEAFKEEQQVRKKTDRVQLEDIIQKKEIQIRDLMLQNNKLELLVLEKEKRIKEKEQQILQLKSNQNGIENNPNMIDNELDFNQDNDIQNLRKQLENLNNKSNLIKNSFNQEVFSQKNIEHSHNDVQSQRPLSHKNRVY